MCGSKTTTQNSQYGATPEATSAYNDVLGRVNALPYGSYSGPLTAGINAQQDTGTGTINDAAAYGTPLFNQAAGLASSSTAPVSQADIDRYQNPYTQEVVDATQRQFNNTNAQQLQGVKGNAIAQNALGGNREAVAESTLSGQQRAAQDPIIAGLYSSGFNTALGAAQKQQSTGLYGSSALSGIGTAGTNAGVSAGNAQFGAGTTGQTTTQAGYDALLKNWLLPYNQLASIGNIDTGVGSALGGWGTKQTTTPPPNPTNQIIGGLTAAASFANRGGRIRGYAQGGQPQGLDFGTFTSLGGIPGVLSVQQHPMREPDYLDVKGQDEKQPDYKKFGTAMKGLYNKYGSSDAPAGQPLSLAPPGINSDMGWGGPPSGWGAPGFEDGGAPNGRFDELTDMPAPISGLAPTSTGTPGSFTPKMDSALGGIESGGRFDAVGPPVKRPDGSTDRAYGYSQVMGSNIPEWTKAVLGKAMTPEEYLASPEAQKAVTKAKFSSYVDKYGPEGAAKAWFAGERGMNDPNRRDVLGTTVQGYADKFMGLAGNEPAPATEALGYAPEGGTSGLGPAPAAAPQKRSGLFGLGLSDEARQGLLTAGLGMLASRSPYFGVGIGEGALQGVQSYQQAKSATRLEEQAQLARRKADEQERHQRETERRSQSSLDEQVRHQTEADKAKQQSEDRMLRFQQNQMDRQNLQHLGTNEDGYPVYLDRRTGKEQVGTMKIQDKAPPGYVRNPDGTMSAIKGGPQDPEIVRGMAQAKQGEAMPDATADFLSERVLAGDAKALVGLGRGAQGAANILKVQELAANKAAARGMNASDILAKVAEQSGLTAQQRTFGTQVAKMAVNSTEAEGAIQQGLEVSKKVPRTSFVPINKLVQMAESNISDPDLLEFRAANLAIINTYARAINPNGVGTVHDKEEALKIVSEATSPEAYERVMNRMLKEIDIAHKAPTKAKAELERIRKSNVVDQKVEAAPPSTPSDPKEGDTATNPSTNAKIIYRGGKWVPQ